MKNFIALFLTLSLMLSFAALLSSCDTNDEVKDGTDTHEQTTQNEPSDENKSTEFADLEFRLLNDGTYGVAMGNTGELETIEIPATHNGKAVTQIVDNAFENAANLKTVVIPDSITSIGHWAFTGCKSLTSINVPNSVTSIGQYAFFTESELSFNEYDNAYYLGNTSNPYLVLVTAKNRDITSCEINENTKFIHSSAFGLCQSLKSIVIPNCVTDICIGAFNNCYNLESIIIGNNVTRISFYMFDSCKALESITIGNSVTIIDSYAFFGCDSLTSIIIPDSVKSIGESAFNSCEKLENVTMGNGVTNLDFRAFSNCTSLTSISIPDTVTNIGAQAFSKCTALESINIGNGVTSIGESAFYDCKLLTSINFKGLKTQWNEISKEDNWNKNTGAYTIHCTDGDIAK